MIYLIDPTEVSKNRCPDFCRIVITPLYGVIVWPGP